MEVEEFVDFKEEGGSWNPINSVMYTFENYGWHILIGSIVAVVIYNRFIHSYIQKYKEYKFEKDYAAKYHKNPDVFAAHVNAQQEWVQKLQEKYNKESEEYQRKMKEREEKKKQELREKFEDSSGHVLGNKKDDTLRPGYNPLMGAGSSSNYRPPRRSPCGGGGCGK